VVEDHVHDHFQAHAVRRLHEIAKFTHVAGRVRRHAITRLRREERECGRSRLREGLLQEGREADPLLHAGDDEDYQLGFNTMRLFVERFYQSGIVQNLFFEADRDPELKGQIARLLSGDLWADNNALQQSLLAGRRMAN